MSYYNNNEDWMNRFQRPQGPRNSTVKNVDVVSKRVKEIQHMKKTLEARIKSLQMYKNYDPIVSTNNIPKQSSAKMIRFIQQSKKFATDEITSLSRIIQGYDFQLKSFPSVITKKVPVRTATGQPSTKNVKFLSYYPDVKSRWF
jgi:hypothetical protein